MDGFNGRCRQIYQIWILWVIDIQVLLLMYKNPTPVDTLRFVHSVQGGLQKLPSLKLTFSLLKINGWKMIHVRPWGPANCQGGELSVLGRVLGIPLPRNPTNFQATLQDLHFRPRRCPEDNPVVQPSLDWAAWPVQRPQDENHPGEVAR